MPADQPPEFSFPVDVTALPPSGRHYEITAGAQDCARVAERLGVPEVAALTGSFDLAPRAGGLVHVTGRIHARLTQVCVVTLALLAAAVDEEVDVRFATSAAKAEPRKRAAGSPVRDRESDTSTADEDLEGLDGEEPPEDASSGWVDLGELAVVHLALGIDPYPRAPGAAFDPSSSAARGGKSEPDSPFAVLAKLKDKGPARGG